MNTCWRTPSTLTSIWCGSVEPFDQLVAIARQPQLELVLAVGRKRVLHARAGARAERLAVEVIFLGQVGRQNDGLRAGRAHRRADGEAADLLRGRQISLEQHRRQPADADVVEAMARVVARQQRRDVDLEVEQIADGVLIFRAVQPAERVGAAGIGIRAGGAIERRFEVRDQRVVGGFGRAAAGRPEASRARAACGRRAPSARHGCRRWPTSSVLRTKLPCFGLLVMTADAVASSAIGRDRSVDRRPDCGQRRTRPVLGRACR